MSGDYLGSDDVGCLLAHARDVGPTYIKFLAGRDTRELA